MPLDTLIRIAYRVPRVPLDCVVVKAKGADWVNGDWWDLDAKNEQPFTEPEMIAMLQNLLADRFKLQIEKERKPGTVYVLTVDPGGLKLKKNEDPTAYPRRELVMEGTAPNMKVVLRATAITMGDLLFTSPFWELRAPVVDATGLVDRYDIHWVFGQGGDQVLQPPNVIESCKRELGLKLQETKGQIDILNIVHVEKPSEN